MMWGYQPAPQMIYNPNPTSDMVSKNCAFQSDGQDGKETYFQCHFKCGLAFDLNERDTLDVAPSNRKYQGDDRSSISNQPLAPIEKRSPPLPPPPSPPSLPLPPFSPLFLSPSSLSSIPSFIFLFLLLLLFLLFLLLHILFLLLLLYHHCKKHTLSFRTSQLTKDPRTPLPADKDGVLLDGTHTIINPNPDNNANATKDPHSCWTKPAGHAVAMDRDDFAPGLCQICMTQWGFGPVPQYQL